MTTSVAAADRSSPAERSLSERANAALPLLTVYVWLALVCTWQAWLVPTPSIFPDEVKYAELARAIAENGRPALRGVAQGWESLPVWLTAPAWLLDDAADGYLAAKLIGVLAMAAVVFPAYGLARLVAPRGPALFAAAAAGAIPAMSYSALLMQEPFAYPAATLALYLGVRALARPTRSTLAAAVAVAAGAALVREQLLLLPAVLAVAGAIVAWRSPRAARLRRGRRPRAWMAFALALAAVAVSAHVLLLRASVVWRAAAETPGAVAEYAVWALGGLTIGLAVLPVVATLACAATPRPGRNEREWDAFVAVLGPAVAAFAIYTGAKLAYLDDSWTVPVEERNVIYLAPLFLAGTARWLARPRVSPVALAGAALATLAVLRLTPSILLLPYFEAPGFSLLAGLHRAGRLSAEAAADAEVAVVAGAAAVVLVARLSAHWAGLLARAAAAACLVALGAGQLYASAGQRDLAELMRAEAIQPYDWLDRLATGRTVLYVGRGSANLNAFMTLEFWNESLRHVGSLGGVPPPPGPGYAQVVATPDGIVAPTPAAELVVTDADFVPVGRLVMKRGAWRVFAHEPPLRLRQSVDGVYADGWAGSLASYSRFAATAPGTVLEITVARTGWTGPSPRSTVTVESGALAVEAGAMRLASVAETRTARLTSGEVRTFRLPAPNRPFRVEVNVSPTFVPAELDARYGDTRALGAQVGFRLLPARQ